MSNHLAKYYMNLLFIVLLGIGCITISFIGTFAEMLALYDASYHMDILLSGFSGAMIIAILKSWRCIDREIKRRLTHSPLNSLEKEWMECMLFYFNDHLNNKPLYQRLIILTIIFPYFFFLFSTCFLMISSLSPPSFIFKKKTTVYGGGFLSQFLFNVSDKLNDPCFYKSKILSY